MPDDERSVEAFYNRLSPRYSEAIQRCVPRYAEMLRTLVDCPWRHLLWTVLIARTP